MLSTNDGSTTDDRVPTPWMNHNSVFYIPMSRNLLIADVPFISRNKSGFGRKCRRSDDGLTYTITMKDGVKWSDGEDIGRGACNLVYKHGSGSSPENSVIYSVAGNITDLTADGNVITMKTWHLQTDERYFVNFFILPKH